MLKILVADDSAVVRKHIIRDIRQFFFGEKNNLVIIEANDGVEAVSLAIRHRPKLMIVDMNMPGLIGVEVIETLRKQDIYIPTVVITAECAKSLVIKAVQVGAQGYLLKPYQEEQLFNTILPYIKTA